MKKITILTLMVLLLAPLHYCLSQYQIKRSVISNGGEIATSPSFTAKFTVGQPVIGITENNDYTGKLGFWYTIPTTNPNMEINLAQGWNLISSYIIPQLLPMENVWEDISSSLVIVRNNAGQMYYPLANINTIGNWNVSEGYLTYMLTASTLTITGTRVDPQTPISLPSGWNIISYYHSTEIDIVTALASITSNLVLAKNNAGDIYMPSLNYNSIGNMIPGQGYQTYLTANSTLVYPSANPKLSDFPEFEKPSEPLILKTNSSLTGNNATLILTLPSYFEGYEVAVKNFSNKIYGSTVVKNGKCVINIWGDNSITDFIDGATENEELSVYALNPTTLNYENIELSNIRNFVTNESFDKLIYNSNSILAANTSNPSAESLELTNYPNPFSDKTLVNYTINDDANVKLSIYSLDGKLIAELLNEFKHKGSYSLLYKRENISNGLYYIKLSNGITQIVKPLIIVD